MMLQEQTLLAALKQQWHGDLEIELYESLESTNRHLAARVADDAGHPQLLCATEQQTKGVGRRGKSWHSPSCSITFSLARRFDQPPATLMGLSLVTGLAVADVLESVSNTPISVKWPNDLLVGGKKLGGILIEVPRADASSSSVVTGIGINVVNGPEHQAIDQPFTSLQALQQTKSLDISELTGRLAGQVLTDYDHFCQLGWTAFEQRWSARDYLNGKNVVIHAGKDPATHAIARGVAADGGLLVEQNGINKTIYSADVSVRVNN